MCLRGASEVENDVLKKDDDPSLTAFVVWVPKRHARESDVAEATRLVPDPRATHWWDPAGETFKPFARAIGIDEDAWDVYLVYGPDAHWDAVDPPKPRFWMHQLGGESRGPRLDGEVLEKNVIAASPP